MKLKYLMVLAMICALSVGLVACGSDDSDDSSSSSESTSNKLIESNTENEGVKLTIGSKNFTEQILLGEIYSQALNAAGYDVDTDLNLGSETVALQALQADEISGYPEYVSTALSSFFDVDTSDVPNDAQEAYEMVQQKLKKEGLVAFTPTPFEDANAVGMLASKADELGVTSISDLEGKDQDLKLYGSPECRQRADCLLGLQEDYGLDFASFTPVDIGLRYEVLDKEQADLSIVFTSDAQLAVSDEYTVLEDDKGILPAGNVVFLSDEKTVEEAGPDYASTIEAVQEGLNLEVIQELNARVDIDKETPEDVAADYLQSAGYTE